MVYSYQTQLTILVLHNIVTFERTDYTNDQNSVNQLNQILISFQHKFPVLKYNHQSANGF